MNRVRVVAAVVRRGSALLITRRIDRDGKRGQWEFPGGKVENGEGEEAALAREMNEELGIEFAAGPLLLRHCHSYPHLDVEIAFFGGHLVGEPVALGVAEYAWAEKGTLGRYDFLEADRAVLEELERLA